MNTPEQILIKSNEVQIVGDGGPIFLNTNKEIHLGANKILFDIGPVGSKDPQFKFLVNSPRIELGIPNSSVPLLQLEAIPKSDQLIQVLQQMLSIMNDIINNPEEVKCITEEINLISQQLYKIKSEISYTV